MKKTALLVIDPQKDFCSPKGSLYVKGADDDMKRLSNMINTLINDISEIIVSLDSHHNYHIAHPIFWRDVDGNHPKPFTLITKDDIKNGRYSTFNKAHAAWAKEYVSNLEMNGRYQLCIWPPHCVIGTHGFSIDDNISDALKQYEDTKMCEVEYIIKGECALTEHYSILKADVKVENDNRTFIRADLVTKLKKYDTILIAGEALSHCVANTLYDFAAEFNDDLSKFILLEDASSSVSGFEDLGVDFISKAVVLGMRRSTTKDIAEYIK